MEQGIKMRVIQQAAGNYDPRVLSGDGVRLPDAKNLKDAGGISWGGGEIIFVTEDLAQAYEASGMAERFTEPQLPKPKGPARIGKAQPASGLELRDGAAKHESEK